MELLSFDRVPACTLSRSSRLGRLRLVLCCSVTIVKICSTFTNEVYSSCNGNCRAAMVEYRQYPLSKTFEKVHRTLMDTDALPQVNAEREQQRHGDYLLAAVQ